MNAIWWTIKQGTDLPEGLASYDHGELRSYSGEDVGVTDITSLAEKSEGMLLVATDKGVFTLDGERWAHFGVEAGLPFEQVRDITVDPEGNVWIWCTPDPKTSLGALARFDGEPMCVFELKPQPVRARGGPSAIDNEGRIWFVANDGLHSYMRGEWEHIALDREILGAPLRVSDDGVIWWAQSSDWQTREDAGIWRYADGVAQFFNDDDGLPLDYCRDLEVDSNTYSRGGWHILRISCSNEGETAAADLYVALCCLGNVWLYYPSFSDMAAPFLSSFELSAGFSMPSYELVKQELPGLATGTYVWYAAFTTPGTMDFLSDIAVAPWSFTE